LSHAQARNRTALTISGIHLRVFTSSLRVSVVAVLVALVGAACGRAPEPVVESDAEHGFVGRAVCAECHAAEADAWQGSHHDLAIEAADEATVLGDFSDATFDYFGTVTRFLVRDGKYIVQTPGEGGEPREFPVKYTFGVEPLQQYLVEFPGGRLQALPFSWDTRPEEDGGQRWFHVYPHEMIAPDDPLYWTGREQNWNYMCAECHSTQVELGYDRSGDSFATSWKDIDVSCEACHGPGSVHVAQAESGAFDAQRGLAVDLDDRNGAAWVMNPDTGIAERSPPRREPLRQPEACGRCHSRRGVIAPEYEYGRPLADSHLPALLEEPLYFPDGQIREEVYVYGSFLQSRMYRSGVSCSDCHEPHSLKLVTGDDPNAVCAQCHLPAKFATDEHRRHGAEIAGCVDCHMRERTYMVVDDRRDHSFRIPRPDLSERLGTPNACNGCHTDREPSWAISIVAEWYGDDVFERPEFATALSAARVGHANDALRDVLRSPEQPGIARATALTLIDQPMSDEDLAAIESAVKDPDPLLRMAAHRVLRNLPVDVRSGFGYGGLSDPVRSVRMEAALVFAPLHDLLPAADARAFREAAADYRAAFEYTANRPESLARLGDLALAMGDLEAALARYEQALAVEPASVVARANLADIHRGLGDEAEAERILREGLTIEPGNAALNHALGLLLARTGRPDESLAKLREAARLGPDDPRFAYVLGVALNSFGMGDEAVAVLKSARQQYPANFDINWALATIYRDRGDLPRARAITEALLERHPELQELKTLHRSLSAQP
jgi:tetratricopeptide (TPR) repeat protein